MPSTNNSSLQIAATPVISSEIALCRVEKTRMTRRHRKTFFCFSLRLQMIWRAILWGQLKVIPFHSISPMDRKLSCIEKKFSADNYNFYGAAFHSTIFFPLLSQIAGPSREGGEEQKREKNEKMPTRFAVNQVERLNSSCFFRFPSSTMFTGLTSQPQC